MATKKVYKYSIKNETTGVEVESKEYAEEYAIEKISGAVIKRNSVKTVNDFEVDKDGIYLEGRAERKGFGL